MTSDLETIRTMLPFWGRATIVESTVDEEQHPSGLVLPIQLDDDGDIHRGVVVAVDATDDYRAKLEPGTAVYFRGGVKIGDVYVVDMPDILIYQP